MMTNPTLTAQPRPDSGKGYARRARRAGYVPGVIYGNKAGNVPVVFSAHELSRFILSGEAGKLFDVKVNRKKFTVLLKEVQKDPLKGNLIHVDLHEVDLDKQVETAVPIYMTGEDRRESDGGVIIQNLRELRISCLPKDIPDIISVDVSGMAVGDSVLVGALALPEGVAAVDDPEETVLSVILPRQIKAEEPETDHEMTPTEETESAKEE
jgi:large subunit ribosomal protein L25